MWHDFTPRQRLTGARRLRRHAPFIAALPHKGKLAMMGFVVTDDNGNLPSLRHCNTAACGLGWLPVSERRDWCFNENGDPAQQGRRIGDHHDQRPHHCGGQDESEFSRVTHWWYFLCLLRNRYCLIPLDFLAVSTRSNPR